MAVFLELIYLLRRVVEDLREDLDSVLAEQGRRRAHCVVTAAVLYRRTDDLGMSSVGQFDILHQAHGSHMLIAEHLAEKQT